ncbi:serine/arginine repetitive matrix protein 1-like [Penaeus vannamei]|uniref:serine/arginine repetitive matrix protein 1-like n=1 Tax=Penaeus vannamei TaxID=6689 RepID=UPI00387F6F76
MSVPICRALPAAPHARSPPAPSPPPSRPQGSPSPRKSLKEVEREKSRWNFLFGRPRKKRNQKSRSLQLPFGASVRDRTRLPRSAPERGAREENCIEAARTRPWALATRVPRKVPLQADDSRPAAPLSGAKEQGEAEARRQAAAHTARLRASTSGRVVSPLLWASPRPLGRTQEVAVLQGRAGGRGGACTPRGMRDRAAEAVAERRREGPPSPRRPPSPEPISGPRLDGTRTADPQTTPQNSKIATAEWQQEPRRTREPRGLRQRQEAVMRTEVLL